MELQEALARGVGGPFQNSKPLPARSNYHLTSPNWRLIEIRERYVVGGWLCHTATWSLWVAQFLSYEQSRDSNKALFWLHGVWVGAV